MCKSCRFWQWPHQIYVKVREAAVRHGDVFRFQVDMFVYFAQLAAHAAAS
jgi:hypothetical protein